jgi:hypothetical protein
MLADTEIGYRKNELAGRMCIWWTASPASGAVGGILAGAIIGNLHNTSGLHGWQVSCPSQAALIWQR